MTFSIPQAHTQISPSRVKSSLTRLPAAVVPTPVPSALSLEALGGGGLSLSGVPLIYNRTLPGPADLQTIAHMLSAGLLPSLPPKRNEAVGSYLKRLGQYARPEGFSLDLQTYRKEDDFIHVPDERPGMLLLTLGAGEHQYTRDVTSRYFAAETAAIHPRFFGSLMVHLSRATADVWPVYTIYDALLCASNWRYQGEDDFGFGEFWTTHRQEFENEFGHSPTRAELNAHLKALGLTTPRELFRHIGLNEVLPALKEHLCLSVDELEALARQSRFVWVIRAVEQLREIQALQSVLEDEQTDDESTVQTLSGETRIRPVYTITAQKTRRRWTDVEELANEEEQVIEGGDGYREPFSLLIYDEQSARHAARYLSAVRQMRDSISDLIDDIADDDDWE